MTDSRAYMFRASVLARSQQRDGGVRIYTPARVKKRGFLPIAGGNGGKNQMLSACGGGGPGVKMNVVEDGSERRDGDERR